MNKQKKVTISPSRCQICGRGVNQYVNHAKCSRIKQQAFKAQNKNRER